MLYILHVLLYVKTNPILFDLFPSTLVLVMRFFQFLMVVEILYLKVFCWNLDL